MSNAKRQKKYQKRKKAEEGGILVDKRGSTCKIALYPFQNYRKKSLSKRRKRIKEIMRKHRQRAKEGTHVVVKMDFKNNSHGVKRKKKQQQ